jgi:hypothetical protein
MSLASRSGRTSKIQFSSGSIAGRAHWRRRQHRIFLTAVAAGVPVCLQVERASADITGFGDGSQWTINSGGTIPPAIISPTDLQLTAASNGQSGTAWFNTPQEVDNFTAQFHYNFFNGSGTPADGVTFAMQNSAGGTSALGGGGGSLGYGGILTSAAFEINIYAPNVKGVSLQTGGATGGYLPPGAINVLNTNGVDITLQYNGSFMKETLTQGTNTYSNNILIDIVTAVGATNALVGFTGATGGENANQHVTNFTFVAGTNAVGPGPGTDFHWNSLNGNWTNNVNWLPPTSFPGANPALLDNAFIDNAAGLVTGATAHVNTVIPQLINTLTVNNGNTLSVEPGGALTVAGARSVFGNASGPGTLAISGGTFTATAVLIGDAGSSGTLTLGGTGNLVTTLGHVNDQGDGDNLIGNGAGSTATFNMTGGVANTSTWLRVGNNGGTGTFNMTGGSFNTTARFYVGWGAGSSGHLVMSGGTINTGAEFDVGVNGGAVGVVDQTGGNINILHSTGANAWLTISQSGAGSTGTYNISGGSVTVADDMRVGQDSGSNGALNISGNGVVTAGTNGGVPSIGRGGGSGTLTISGNGILNAQVDMSVGRDPGSVGVFNQTGGTYNQTNITNIGRNAGVGTYNISGNAVYNLINGNRMSIGRDALAIGTLNISGSAQLTINRGGLVLSENTGQGTVNQSGGVFNIGTGTNEGHLSVGGGTPDAGQAVYNLSAGTINIGNNGTNALMVGAFDGSDGVFNMTGTSGAAIINTPNLLIGPNNTATGVFNQSGGKINILGAGTGNVVVGRADGGSTAAYNLSGGALDPGNLTVNPNGSFLQTGGSATVNVFTQVTGGVVAIGGGPGPAAFSASRITADSITVSNNARVTLATLGVPFSNTNTINTLTLTGNGTLDLSNQQLLTNTAPATIKGYLAAAYDGAGNADWGKPGLTSGLAKGNPTTFSVGYAFAGDQSTMDAGITAHGGLPLAAGQTIVRPVLTGDANMDGKVDFFDITQLLGYKYNTGQPASYTDGDLDYNGKVDFFDIVLLLSANYNTGTTFGPAAAAAAAKGGHSALTASSAIAQATTVGTPGDGKPDFVYNPATGHLTFATDGGTFTTTGGAASFVSSLTISSASGELIGAGASSTFAGGTGATLTSTLLSSALTNSPGFTDGFDIGAVLPTGLTIAQLTADLTVKYQSLNGGSLKTSDILVPEPTGLALLGLGAAGLLARRRQNRSRRQ